MSTYTVYYDVFSNSVTWRQSDAKRCADRVDAESAQEAEKIISTRLNKNPETRNKFKVTKVYPFPEARFS